MFQNMTGQKKEKKTLDAKINTKGKKLTTPFLSRSLTPSIEGGG